MLIVGCRNALALQMLENIIIEHNEGIERTSASMINEYFEIIAFCDMINVATSFLWFLLAKETKAVCHLKCPFILTLSALDYG